MSLSVEPSLDSSLPEVIAGCDCRLIAASDHPAWDRFVNEHPDGSPFHLIAWMQAIKATFGYQPYYVGAFLEGRLCGVLPLFLVANWFTPKCLISSPFAVYGGALTSDPNVKPALAQFLRTLASELGVDCVELRNSSPDQLLGFTPVNRYVTFHQEIGTNEEAILNSIPRKTRAVVRKALKEPFSTRQTTEIDAFVDLYSKNLKRLGTPCFPVSHFQNLMRYFGPQSGIREITLDGGVVAAVFSFTFRDRVLPYYGASDPAFNSKGAASYMYFDQMRSCGAEGLRVFDFGRSKKEGSGSYDFKAHWGMMERELPYEVLLVRAKEVGNNSPNNPKYQAMIRLWQRLPLWLTRLLGPRLIRFFP